MPYPNSAKPPENDLEEEVIIILNNFDLNSTDSEDESMDDLEEDVRDPDNDF